MTGPGSREYDRQCHVLPNDQHRQLASITITINIAVSVWGSASMAQGTNLVAVSREARPHYRPLGTSPPRGI